MNNHKINLSSGLKTSVLFIVFNRPNTTLEVFDKIRQARPLKLYVASDGPHAGNEDQKEKVTKVRKIITGVDWPCEVKTIFRDKNLGCKMGVSSALNWFFEQEDQGIILEDDCVPHLDFFAFCENLLDYYRNDERISIISGNNFQNMKWRGDASYYFSKYTHIWGWATWRRAWKYYQRDMNFWPDWKISNDWKKYNSDKIERKYWEIKFERSYVGKVDSWAYPWMASTWYKKGLTAIPNVNLVTNIGFGKDATHTIDNSNKFMKVSSKGLSHIIHPNQVIINKEADKFVFDNIYRGKFLRFPYNWLLFSYRVFNYILRKIIMDKEK